MTAKRTGYLDVMNRLVAWARVYHGADNLGDVLELGLDRLLEEMCLQNDVPRIDLVSLPPEEISRLQVGSVIADAINALDGRKREIALRRTFSRDPDTLASIGKSFGISRERVRQLEQQVIRIFEKSTGDSLTRATVGLRRVLGRVVRKDSLVSVVKRLTIDAPPSMHELASQILLEHTGYAFAGQLAIADDYDALVEDIATRAEDVSDEHGIVDEATLRQTIDVKDNQLWNQVITDAGLTRVCGSLVLRNTQRVRAIIALRQIGEPATKEEIAEIADVDPHNVAALISDEADVVRVTKNTWGFADWTDDPFDGVMGEIVQRIIEDGGVTNVDRLLEEIPNKFKVSAGTVKAYLATDKFKVSDGSVRIAEEIELDLRPLSRLQEIVWDEDGTPVLRFTVEERYLTGYSMKIPAEVASYLGVKPDERTTVQFKRPDIDVHASIIWRAHDPSGPRLGQLREALETIGAVPNQEVFLVLDPEGLVILEEGSDFTLAAAENESPGSDTQRDAPDETLIELKSDAIQKMKDRRKIWSSDA